MPSSESWTKSPAPSEATPAAAPASAPIVAPVAAIVGPTASGKSAWALQLAQALDGEIISADSRQLYRRLEIGSAKPTAADRALIPHHCLDLRDPSEPISLAEYLEAARAAIADVQRRGKPAIVVGGSGQYVWALLEGWIVPPAPPDPALRERLTAEAQSRGAPALHRELARVDPESAAQIEPNNLRRIIRALEVHHATGRPISSWRQERRPLKFAAFAPALSQTELDERIDRRTAAMFRNGLVKEVADLLREGVPPNAPAFKAIGYPEVLAHLRREPPPGESPPGESPPGEYSLLDAVAAVARATQRYSRRQRPWFRPNDPRIAWSTHPPPPKSVAAHLQKLPHRAKRPI